MAISKYQRQLLVHFRFDRPIRLLRGKLGVNTGKQRTNTLYFSVCVSKQSPKICGSFISVFFLFFFFVVFLYVLYVFVPLALLGRLSFSLLSALTGFLVYVYAAAAVVVSLAHGLNLG